ncbi:MAG: trypsin-like peptidase domain-containing protein [Fuerstiella sp.]
MSRIIQCPSCEKQLKLGEATSQKSVISCPACSQKIRINSESPPPVAAPVEPARPRKPAARQNQPAPTKRKQAASARPSSRQSSRRSAVSQHDEYADYDDYDDYLPDDSARPSQAKSSRGRKKQASNNRVMGVIFVAGSVAAGILALAGAIWWVVNTLGDDSADPNNQNIAETDDGNQPSSDNKNSSTGPATSGGQPKNSPPTYAPVTVAKNPAHKFRYRLTPGETHVYTFELDAEVDRKTLSFPGSVTMTVAKGRSALPDEVQSGTGTGFVVSSNGFLITCHHVVEDATSVEVILNGKTHVGRVVAVNKDQDLALVKIDVNNLASVSLADSGRVQLAEDVRAIGFPLTDLLGQGLKVTRGTISGINDDPEGRRFQIDANINPGNSGGPLFNERGQVIAINSAKLISGSSISSVGFSVPVNYAKQLLQQNRVPFQANEGGPILAGPQLVQNVKPAVALLKVESRRKINQQYVLNYNGSYTDPTANTGSSIRGPGGMRLPPGMRFGPSISTSSRTYSRGKVILDEYGSVNSFEDQHQLPFSTGSMAMLMIHELDPDGSQTWSHENRFVLTKPKERSNNPFGFPGPRFGGPFGGGPFGSQQQEPDEVLTGGIETHRYRILEANDREIKISRKYELRTLDNPSKPMTKITGEGTIVFDRKFALPKSMSYRQTYESNSSGESVKIPIAISYRMQDPSILKNRKAEIAKAAAEKKAAADAQAAKEAAMSPDERLDFYIAEIKAKRGKAIFKKLSELEVDESRREEVSELLAPCLATRRPDGNQLLALGQWATPKTVGVMITKLDLMDGGDWPSGRTLVTALGRTKDERAIKPIVKKLAASHPWHDAVHKALINFGAKAEDDVLALLAVNPTAEAVKVLGAIGTKKCMSVLKELVNHSDHWIKKEAKEAITQVAVRNS